MKVHSAYLKKDFEVTAFAASEGGEEIQVISHEALEDIVHNQIPAEINCRYELKPLYVSPAHCVFTCTVYDDRSRRIQAVGESTLASLETEIAQKYPATMAAQRAFDRAVIRYLDLPGKTLSNLEGVGYNGAEDGTTEVTLGDDVPEDAPMGRNAQPAAADAPAGRQVAAGATNGPAAVNDASGKENASRSRAEVHGDGRPQPSSASRATGAAQPAPAPQQGSAGEAPKPAQQGQANNDKDDGPGAVMLDIGRYRGKNKSVAAVYKEAPDYVKWVVEKFSGTGDKADGIRKACKAFLDAQNGGR